MILNHSRRAKAEAKKSKNKQKRSKNLNIWELFHFLFRIVWMGLKSETTHKLQALSCIQIKQKWMRKQKFSLIFAVYSLIFFAFASLFSVWMDLKSETMYKIQPLVLQGFQGVQAVCSTDQEAVFVRHEVGVRLRRATPNLHTEDGVHL